MRESMHENEGSRRFKSAPLRQRVCAVSRFSTEKGQRDRKYFVLQVTFPSQATFL